MRLSPLNKLILESNKILNEEGALEVWRFLRRMYHHVLYGYHQLFYHLKDYLVCKYLLRTGYLDVKFMPLLRACHSRYLTYHFWNPHISSLGWVSYNNWYRKDL